MYVQCASKSFLTSDTSSGSTPTIMKQKYHETIVTPSTTTDCLFQFEYWRSSRAVNTNTTSSSTAREAPGSMFVSLRYHSAIEFNFQLIMLKLPFLSSLLRTTAMPYRTDDSLSSTACLCGVWRCVRKQRNVVDDVESVCVVAYE